jgi:TolB-like protein/Flp pilus assembly protein TadD
VATVWGELKRRNVVRVAVAYVIVAWLLLEISSVLAPALRLPEWSMTLVVYLLILAFPMALVLSWAYEMTPEGIRKEKDVEREQSITQQTGRKLNVFIIGTLAVTLAFVAFDQYVVEERADAIPRGVQQDGRLPNSVAVLPFDNLGPAGQYEYFAAGIHEEVINQLVKIRDLSVIARTSVMQYGGVERPIVEIADELNVEMILIGSVQFSGDDVRILVTLVDGRTGVNVWADPYQEKFADIFDIQTAIATEVAASLRAELTPAERKRIERIPTNSLQAYDLFLKAADRWSVLSGGQAAIVNAITLLDRAVEIDPEFALAYAWRAWYRRGLMSRGRDADIQALESLVIEDLDTALRLDPELGMAHYLMATVHASHWREAEAAREYALGLRFSPNDAAGVGAYSRFSAYTSNVDEAIRLARKAIQLRPNEPIYLHYLGMIYTFAGNDDAAIGAFERALERGGDEGYYSDAYTRLEISWILSRRRDYSNALRQVRTAERMAAGHPAYGNEFRALLAYSYRLAGDATKAASVAKTVLTQPGDSLVTQQQRAFANLAISDNETAIANLEAASGQWAFLPRGMMTIKRNTYRDPVLERPEFAAIRNELGFRD